jgi:hypothetical protein
MVRQLAEAVHGLAQGAWSRLAAGFPERAQRLRAQSLARAEQLGEVVQAMLGPEDRKETEQTQAAG